MPCLDICGEIKKPRGKFPEGIDKTINVCYHKGVGIAGNGCFPHVIKKITARFGRLGGYLFLLLLSNDIIAMTKVAISMRSRQVM